MRADVTHNLVRSFNTTAEAADLDRLSALYEEMERSLTRTLEEEGIAQEDLTLKRFIDARYSGQVYEIETPVPSAETLTDGRSRRPSSPPSRMPTKCSTITAWKDIRRSSCPVGSKRGRTGPMR